MNVEPPIPPPSPPSPPSGSRYAVTVLVVDRATGTLYSTIWEARSIRVAHVPVPVHGNAHGNAHGNGNGNAHGDGNGGDVQDVQGALDQCPLTNIILLDASFVDSSINGE